MRASINSKALRRLEILEQRRSATRIVGLWPAILGLDAWEALAGPMQEKLCMDTRHDDSVVIENDAPVVNTQAEHERLYQEFKKSLPEAGRQYLKQKQKQIKAATIR